MIAPRRVEPAPGPLDVEVRVPGSKSITNRALLLGALAVGESTLEGALFASDTRALAAILRTAGVGIGADETERRFEITGAGGPFPGGGGALWAELSGTTARFVLPVLALSPGTWTLDGAPPLRARPLGDLVSPLRALGAEVEWLAQEGHLPVRVGGRGLPGGRIEVSGEVSSQFLSGLLMAGPLFSEGLELVVTGRLVSRPYVDMTVALMSRFGIEVTLGSRTTSAGDILSWSVPQGPYRAAHLTVEPDASAASYMWGAAAVCGGRVRVGGLGPDSLQGDVRFVDVLERMGARVVRTPGGTEVVVDAPLSGVDVDMSDISDTVQTLAAVAAFAVGPTRIRGVGFIRHKETDRIAAVVAELGRCGIGAEETADGLVVHPGSPVRATVSTYDDHRMAMSLSLVGLGGVGIDIADPDCVSKTFPDFFETLEALTMCEPARTVTIDGPAGSGKSTVARALADSLGAEYLDTGAMYRALTWGVLQAGVDPADSESVARVARHLDVEVSDRVTVDGRDVTEEIRGPEVTAAVSAVAAVPEVRKLMREMQRRWAERVRSCVVEGRDMGTVVFPEAGVKIYLTAPPEVRARRRAAQTGETDLEAVLADIERRDAADSGRRDSPLRPADDAIIYDTGDKTVATIVKELTEIARRAGAGRPSSSEGRNV